MHALGGRIRRKNCVIQGNTLSNEQVLTEMKAVFEITLGELATQHSGLPRMPSNFSPKDQANPYVDYDAGKDVQVY